MAAVELSLYFLSLSYGISFLTLTPSATTNEPPHLIYVTFLPFNVNTGYGCTLVS